MDQSIETTQVSKLTYPAPRTIYLCEPKNSSFNTARRVFALTFRYNENGDIYYGASIYHRNSNKDILVKHTIRETSIARYNTAPVHINIKDYNLSGFNVYYPKPFSQVSQPSEPSSRRVRKNENLPSFEDVVKTVRKAMFTHGVCHRQNVK